MKKALFILLTTLVLGCQSEKDSVVTITTEHGDIKLILYDETPAHKNNFIKLTSQGFYDSTTFHRVINNFMIQGGDPNSKDKIMSNDGQGGPGYTLPAEMNVKFKHIYGAVAAARLGDQVNPQKESSGSQFYIVNNRQGTPFLDGDYTVFGQTIEGFEVLDKISTQPMGQRDRPMSDIKLTIKVEEVTKKEITEKYNYQYDDK